MQTLHWTNIQIPVASAAAAAGLYLINNTAQKEEGVISFADFHVKPGQRT
jgi:hypothetical protein